MSWATTRQVLFALGVLAVVVVVGFGVYFGFFFTPASCSDQKQNQNEEGVDCGGVCTRLCVQPALATLFPPRAVLVAPGVYHAVTMVRNPDTTAAGKFPYTVSLYDADNVLVAIRDGTFTILPGEVAPLFEANIITGERTPTRTFLDIGTGVFTRAERVTPPVRVVSFEVDAERGRISAVIENQTLSSLEEVTITALVYNANDTVVNASQTVAQNLAGNERRSVVFTWQTPFSEPPAKVDIIPRVLE